ncbi:hypothetical protein FD755_025787, partial [Muntiacus reevesi]
MRIHSQGDTGRGVWTWAILLMPFPHTRRPQGLTFGWTRLCFPGCLSLSGPSRVTGIMGGSLSVECRYEEKFINNAKYWCKSPCMLLRKIVETKKPEREARKGRVSIKDHPANLTFTVT